MSAVKSAGAFLVLALGLVGCGGGGGSSPKPVTLTLSFDDLPSVFYGSGTAITTEARLSDQYLLTDGVRFSSGAGYAAVVALPTGDAPSGANAISGSTSDGAVTYAQANPVVVTFFDPARPSVPAGTRSFSVTADKQGLASQNVTLRAYDESGAVVATATTADTGGTTLTVSSPTANIHRVVLLGSEGDADGVAFDDVTFRKVVPLR